MVMLPVRSGSDMVVEVVAPYSRINTISPFTLILLELIKLMAELGIGPTKVERIIAFFKALDFETIQRLPRTYDALKKPFTSMEEIAEIHVVDVEVPPEALKVVEGPAKLQFVYVPLPQSVCTFYPRTAMMPCSRSIGVIGGT